MTCPFLTGTGVAGPPQHLTLSHIPLEILPVGIPSVARNGKPDSKWLKKIKGINWHMCLKNPEVGCTSGEGWFSCSTLSPFPHCPHPQALPSSHDARLLTAYRDKRSFSADKFGPSPSDPPNPPAVEASSLGTVLTFSLHPSSQFYFCALFMRFPSLPLKK